MTRSRYHSRHRALFVALWCALFLLSPAAVRANHLVTLDATVSFDSALSLYTYNYRVTNNLFDPVAVVSFDVFALPEAVLNPTAPSGFNIFFDNVLGEVDLVEDTDTFAPGQTISGFSLQSAFGPNPSVYTYVNAVTGEAAVGGTTLAPTAIPEPGTLVFAGLAFVPGLLLAYRRRS